MEIDILPSSEGGEEFCIGGREVPITGGDIDMGDAVPAL